MVPALADWREQEDRWQHEALGWVRTKLTEHFESERGFAPMTAGDILARLDTDPSMPTAWARLVKSDTVSYRQRYSNVRNILEALARQKIVSMGTTVNAKGNPKSTTYARPRDASAEWTIDIQGSPAAVQRTRQGIRDWLSIDGSMLDGVTSLVFTRKITGSGGDDGSNQSIKAERSRPRRQRRGTRGSNP